MYRHDTRFQIQRDNDCAVSSPIEELRHYLLLLTNAVRQKRQSLEQRAREAPEQTISIETPPIAEPVQEDTVDIKSETDSCPLPCEACEAGETEDSSKTGTEVSSISLLNESLPEEDFSVEEKAEGAEKIAELCEMPSLAFDDFSSLLTSSTAETEAETPFTSTVEADPEQQEEELSLQSIRMSLHSYPIELSTTPNS